MTDKRQPAPLDERDFDAIEAAVMETERGRWFLGEFARRTRMGETRLLLEAVSRLEQNVGGPRPPEEADHVRAALSRLAETLSAAIAAFGGSGDGGAGFQGFVQSVSTMEGASADIHDAAERVNEIAWQLREAGASGRLCSELERAAASISTACAFGGLTARRAKTLADAVTAIEQGFADLPAGWRPMLSTKLNAAREAPVAPPPAPPLSRTRPANPAEPNPAADASARVSIAPTPPEPPRPDMPQPARPADRPVRPPIPSLAAIDRLDFRERLKLFT